MTSETESTQCDHLACLGLSTCKYRPGLDSLTQRIIEAAVDRGIVCLCGDVFETTQAMYDHLVMVHVGIDVRAERHWKASWE